MRVNMHDAKTNLSELVAAAERGQEVIIARNGAPAARLVPVSVEHAPVRLGALAGEIEIGSDFDDPLPEFAPYGA
jgi:prevent-host-death family protein